MKFIKFNLISKLLFSCALNGTSATERTPNQNNLKSPISSTDLTNPDYDQLPPMKKARTETKSTDECTAFVAEIVDEKVKELTSKLIYEENTQSPTKKARLNEGLNFKSNKQRSSVSSAELLRLPTPPAYPSPNLTRNNLLISIPAQVLGLMRPPAANIGHQLNQIKIPFSGVPQQPIQSSLQKSQTHRKKGGFESLLNKSVALYQKGNALQVPAEKITAYGQSIAAWDEALTYDPSPQIKAQILRNKGITLSQKGYALQVPAEKITAYDQSIALYDQALTCNPSPQIKTDILNNKGIALCQKGYALQVPAEKITAYDQAIAALDEALNSNPSPHAKAKILINKGSGLGHKGNTLTDSAEKRTAYDQAIAALDEALTYDPSPELKVKALANKGSALGQRVNALQDHPAKKITACDLALDFFNQAEDIANSDKIKHFISIRILEVIELKKDIIYNQNPINLQDLKKITDELMNVNKKMKNYLSNIK